MERAPYRATDPMVSTPFAKLPVKIDFSIYLDSRAKLNDDDGKFHLRIQPQGAAADVPQF